MVLSQRIARFNRVATNRVLRPLAPVVPGFAVLIHKGRKSGKEYRTQVNVFRTDDGYVIGLTYGPNTDWVKNVLAEGGATVVTRGKTYRLREPEVVHDESRRMMPAVVRPILGVLNVYDFLVLKR